MKKLLIALVVLALSAGAAQASILGGHLSFDGDFDQIRDESRAIFDPSDDDFGRAFAINDDIFGLIRMDSFDGVGVGANVQIFAVFAARITDIDMDGSSRAILDHGAVPDGASHSLASTIDSALVPTGWDFDGSNSIFAVLTRIGDTVFGSDISPLSMVASMTAANGWNLELIGGLSESSDFFELRATPEATAATIQDIIDADAADSELGTVGSERAAFSVQYHVFGSSTVFLPLETVGFTGGNNTTEVSADMVMLPAGSVTASDLANSHVEDNTQFRINPVPEPSAFAVWGAIGLICTAAGVYRRKRRMACGSR